MSAFNFNACSVALTAVVVLSVAGCGCAASPTSAPTGTTVGGFPAGRISLDYVCSREEANLTYPGATVIKDFRNGEVGFNDAFCGHAFATPDDQDKVYDFYTQWLLDHGYQFYSDALGGGDVSDRIFERHPSCREYVSVSTVDPSIYKIVGVASPSIPTGTRTVFEYRFAIGSDGENACHAVRPIPQVPPTSHPLVHPGWVPRQEPRD